MNFSTSPEAQGNRKFWLMFIVAIIGIMVSFWSGFRLGRDIENREWLEIVNPDVAKEREQVRNI